LSDSAHRRVYLMDGSPISPPVPGSALEYHSFGKMNQSFCQPARYQSKIAVVALLKAEPVTVPTEFPSTVTFEMQ